MVKITLSIPRVVDDVKVIELVLSKTMVLLAIEVRNGLDMNDARSLMNELRDTVLRYAGYQRSS